MGPHHPPFYLAPGSGTDVLLVVMGIFLIAALIWVGTPYLRLHSLPERMAGAGQRVLQAGLGQIEAQVMKEGMVAEATCISRRWVIIPMVVTTVQDGVGLMHALLLRIQALLLPIKTLVLSDH